MGFYKDLQIELYEAEEGIDEALGELEELDCHAFEERAEELFVILDSGYARKRSLLGVDELSGEMVS